jgi:hypothetical protein
MVLCTRNSDMIEMSLLLILFRGPLQAGSVFILALVKGSLSLVSFYGKKINSKYIYIF